MSILSHRRLALWYFAKAEEITKMPWYKRLLSGEMSRTFYLELAAKHAIAVINDSDPIMNHND